MTNWLFSSSSPPNVAARDHSFARSAVVRSHWNAIWWHTANSMLVSGHTSVTNAARVLHRKIIWLCIHVSTVRSIRSFVLTVAPHFRVNFNWSTMDAFMAVYHIRVPCAEKSSYRSEHWWLIWGKRKGWSNKQANANFIWFLVVAIVFMPSARLFPSFHLERKKSYK